MRRYEFKVVIFEGSDEFWESIKDKTGCDEVKVCVVEALDANGFCEPETEVTLTAFNNDGA